MFQLNWQVNIQFGMDGEYDISGSSMGVSIVELLRWAWKLKKFHMPANNFFFSDSLSC